MKFRTWKLKRGEVKSEFKDVVDEEGSKKARGNVAGVKASEEVLGRTKSGKKEQRESWW